MCTLCAYKINKQHLLTVWPSKSDSAQHLQSWWYLFLLPLLSFLIFFSGKIARSAFCG